MCASFSSFGNFACSVSEQMFLVNFRIYRRTLFDVVVFFGLIRFSSPSVSDKLSSFNENLGILFNLMLIRKILEWFLHMFTAFSTEFISLLSVSMM